MARLGMTDLISQVRSLTAESGTAIFTDERLQAILDNTKVEFYHVPLCIASQYVNGSAIYKWYFYQHSHYLEGTASGTALVRIYNSNGTTVTNYTTEGSTFTFDTDTRGSAYYYTGRSFNFYKAVADAWKEKAAFHSGNFDFKVEGRSYNKSQVVRHCLSMADYYSAMSDPILHNIDRGDY